MGEKPDLEDWARRRLQPKGIPDLPSATPPPAPPVQPVKREVKRNGKTHTQTYWTRPKK